MTHQSATVFTTTVNSTSNEKIASGNKTFTAADLWNIDRMKRSFAQRRRSL
jgi:hypothetical protein